LIFRYTYQANPSCPCYNYYIYPNQKHPGYKKLQPRIKIGHVEKDVKSINWAAKGSAVIVLMEIKFY